MEEGELQKLFDEGRALETRAREAGDPDLALKAAERFRAVATLLGQLLGDVPEDHVGDAIVNTRRAQREYFLAQEQSGVSWFHYEKRELDAASAAAGRSTDHLERALAFVARAKSQAPDRADLVDKALTWPIHLLGARMMQTAIAARRAWESGDSITAMDHHRRCATLSEEAVRYAEENGLDPMYSRILAGNAFGMQANAAQSAARIFEKRGLEGDERAGLKSIQLQLEAHRLFSLALRANPESRQAEAAMRLIEGNLRRFLGANREHWKKLYRVFDRAPEVSAVMRELDPARFAEIGGA